MFRFHVRAYTLFIIRVAASIVTLVLLALAWWSPQKHVLLHPSAHSVVNLYDDREQATGKSEARWIDRSVFGYVCDIKEGAPYKVCGVSVKFYKEPQTQRVSDGNPASYALLINKNLSEFKGLIFDFSYSGEAKRLRFFARNAINPQNTMDAIRPQKVMFAYSYPEEFRRPKPIYLAFDEFTVADWWMEEYDVRRRYAKPSFDDVVEVSFDLPPDAPLGEHHFVLRTVTGVGEWVAKEIFYWIIITIWLVAVTIEALDKFGRLTYKNQVYRTSLGVLETNNKILLDEANRDPLTGVYNRRGLETVIDLITTGKMSHNSLTLMVFDIDKFKTINDTYGHNIGDTVLLNFATIIESNIRASDKFGRWGGEEFVLISQQPNREEAIAFANKLREAIANGSFSDDDGKPITVTTSAGITQIKAHDSFSGAFNKADIALYAAKEGGRNRVCYQP